MKDGFGQWIRELLGELALHVVVTLAFVVLGGGAVVSFFLGISWLGYTCLALLGLIIGIPVVLAIASGVGIPIRIVREWKTYPRRAKVLLGCLGSLLALMMVVLVVSVVRLLLTP